MEETLTAFKEHITKTYVDTYLNRLLDLRNNIAKANNFEEIRSLLLTEREIMVNDLDGAVKKTPRTKIIKNRGDDSGTPVKAK
jgi:hypothetical protein